MYIYIKKLFANDANGNQISFKKEVAEHFFKASTSFLNTNSYFSIHIFHLSNPQAFTDIDLQSATDYRFSTTLNSFLIQNGQTINEGDLLYVERFIKSYGVKLIKPTDENYDTFDAMLNADDRHFLLSTDEEEGDNHAQAPKPKVDIKEPLQVIHFGAPGTGKSHYVDEKTSDFSVIRTTFHPDSDYSTFVGSYKPEKIQKQKYYTFFDAATRTAHDIPVLDPNGTYAEDSSISYRFIKQAFLKAYLLAWKKYADALVGIPSNSVAGIVPVAFNNGGSSYIITSVQNSGLTYQRDFDDSKSNLSRAWKKCWVTGTFVIPSGRISGESVEFAISQWIVENLDNPTESSLDEGWEKLKDAISQNEKVSANAPSQTYVLSDCDSNKVHVTSSSTRIKESLRSGYENIDECKGVLEQIVRILKAFDNDSFDEAWNKLKKTVESPDSVQADHTIIQPSLEPQFLVIEEINRGNCAQIFGDIFQLLDRQDNGFSSYPIEADADLQKAISDAFLQEPEYKLMHDINVDFAVEHYHSAIKQTLSEDIKDGRVLLLPPNLYIWATMNTSDQSLFPMDSAFKRRWDWKYFSIRDEKQGYAIVPEEGGKTYDWWRTIEALNAKILATTKSADKQLGYWFAKLPKNAKIISAETFASKVVFYLWNDVFKDYSFGGNNPFENETTFEKFYDDKGNVLTSTVTAFLEHNYPSEEEAE